MQLYQPTITGSLAVSGSVSVSGSITIVGGGSIAGTASVAIAALTASSADNFLTRGTLTAQTIVVQTITSSVDFVTGSTQFGSRNTDIHTYTGSLAISGSATTALAVNTNALFVSSSGRIGVGTTNPDQLVTIIGSGSASAAKISTVSDHASFFEASSNNFAVTVRLQSQTLPFVGTLTNTTFDVVAGGKVVIRTTGSGLVGINMSRTPNANLDVSGSFVVTGSANMSGSFTNGILTIINPFTTPELNVTASNMVLSSGYNIYLRPTSGYRVNIDRGDGLYVSGSVGIGITPPSELLHIYKASTFATFLVENGTSNSYALHQARTANSNTWQWGCWNNNSYRVGMSGVADYLTITSGGAVGIGTTSPNSYNDGYGNALVLANTAGSTGVTIVTSTGGNGNIYFADGTTGDQQYRGIIAYEHANDVMRFSTSATEHIRIASNGKVTLPDVPQIGREVGTFNLTGTYQNLLSVPVQSQGILSVVSNSGGTYSMWSIVNQAGNTSVSQLRGNNIDINFTGTNGVVVQLKSTNGATYSDLNWSYFRFT